VQGRASLRVHGPCADSGACCTREAPEGVQAAVSHVRALERHLDGEQYPGAFQAQSPRALFQRYLRSSKGPLRAQKGSLPQATAWGDGRSPPKRWKPPIDDEPHTIDPDVVPDRLVRIHLLAADRSITNQPSHPVSADENETQAPATVPDAGAASTTKIEGRSAQRLIAGHPESYDRAEGWCGARTSERGVGLLWAVTCGCCGCLTPRPVASDPRTAVEKQRRSGSSDPERVDAGPARAPESRRRPFRGSPPAGGTGTRTRGAVGAAVRGGPPPSGKTQLITASSAPPRRARSSQAQPSWRPRCGTGGTSRHVPDRRRERGRGGSASGKEITARRRAGRRSRSTTPYRRPACGALEGQASAPK
jgi:hypothetical protein